MSRTLLMVISGLLLTTAACHPRQTGEATPKPLPSFLEVTNNYALSVEVYIIGGGTSRRMGLVNPGMHGHFDIPAEMIRNGSVVFRASPTQSGQAYESAGQLLSPGQVVELSIASVLFNSTTSVR